MSPTLRLLRLAPAVLRAIRQRRRRQGAPRGVRPLVAIGLGLLALGPLLAAETLLVVVGAALAGAAASASAATGIPPVVLAAYLSGERLASTVAPGCAVPWPVTAGIWKVESSHGGAGGRTVSAEGAVTPPLFGPVLDGSLPQTAIVRDTDHGRWDRLLHPPQSAYDRAVGPAQFLPASWEAYGRDGDGDGARDPHNVFDAALSTAAHLCLRTPGDFSDRSHLARAIRGYNPAEAYLAEVLSWIDYYTRLAAGPTATGSYVFPLPAHLVGLEAIRRPHHDYPASDLPVPVGTPVFSATYGVVAEVSEPCGDPEVCPCGWGVSVRGADGHTYGYCHGSALAPGLLPGTPIAAGGLLMASGSSGRSEGPHLHFQIRTPDGALLCPQPLLDAWWRGLGLSPAAAPLSGCTS